ncbi:MAG TPA: DMT family transporter [Candidatus Bathyarchaeia archaeon]|nr:DMT family transporter [Candidatus Bathyarchaeia archaeon]
MSEVLLGELAALGAAVSWAVAPILYRRALFKTSPISANIVRCVSNAAVMLLVLFALGKVGALASLPAGVVVVTVASGVVGLVIGDTLYLVGLKSVGVARAVPLAATYPLFSLIWATFLLGQSVTATAVLGAFVILLGIWLLSRERGDSSVHFNRRLVVMGLAASLATAVVWSVSVTLMDVAVSMPGVNSLDANYAVITLRIASMALFLGLLAPLLDRGRGFLKMKRNTAIELCIGGLVANGIGWLLMNYSFLNIVESQAVPISSATPLFSALAGFALFHEKITLNSTLGAVMIVAGIFLIFIA